MEPKECKRCGSSDEIVYAGNGVKRTTYMKCNRCCYRGPAVSDAGQTRIVTKALAVEAWNKEQEIAATDAAGEDGG